MMAKGTKALVSTIACFRRSRPAAPKGLRSRARSRGSAFLPLDGAQAEQQTSARREGGGEEQVGGFQSKKRPTDPGGARKVDRRRNGWRSEEWAEVATQQFATPKQRIDQGSAPSEPYDRQKIAGGDGVFSESQREAAVGRLTSGSEQAI